MYYFNLENKQFVYWNIDDEMIRLFYKLYQLQCWLWGVSCHMFVNKATHIIDMHSIVTLCQHFYYNTCVPSWDDAVLIWQLLQNIWTFVMLLTTGAYLFPNYLTCWKLRVYTLSMDASKGTYLMFLA